MQLSPINVNSLSLNSSQMIKSNQSSLSNKTQ